MNNIPQESLDRYNQVLKKLIAYINKEANFPLNLNLVLARDFYNKDELFTKMDDYISEVQNRFEKLVTIIYGYVYMRVNLISNKK